VPTPYKGRAPGLDTRTGGVSRRGDAERTGTALLSP
jgi:hypothetical protein